MEYDWRTRFGLPLTAVGTPDMPWGESYRLVMLLLDDPSSQLAAAAAGWEYPWSRETALLAESYDLHAAVNTKRPKPYPRPWAKSSAAPRKGSTGGRTPEQIRAELARMSGRGSQ